MTAKKTAVRQAYDALFGGHSHPSPGASMDVLNALYEAAREDALTELTPRLCSCMK